MQHHHDHHHDHHHPPHHRRHGSDEEQDASPPPPPSRKEEEEKKAEDEEEDVDAVDIGNLKVEDVDEAYEEAEQEEKDETKESKNNNNQKKNKKPVFKASRAFGTSEGGSPFDHGNNRSIRKMTLYSDGHVVKGMEIVYNAQNTKTAGSLEGDKATFELDRGEVITQVHVRSNKYVQSLQFKTNKGRTFGPVGGKGWNGLVQRKDTEGEEIKVAAPFKFQLCGFRGTGGGCIDTIAFRWGPIPNNNN